MRFRILLLISTIAVLAAGLSENPMKTEPKRLSGAMRALDWWAAMRVDDDGDFPARGWAEAWDTARSLPRPAEKGWTDWAPIGPWNIAGRMLCLAYNPQNPNVIWAGSASGGVWVTRTGGVGPAAWTRVETGHPVLGVSSIAFAPGDSSFVWLGTGEIYGYGLEGGGISVRVTRGSYGIGVLRSSDGGRTWSRSLDWSAHQNRGVQVVRVDPTDRDVVWAGTSEGVYRTVDSGLTWERVLDVLMVTDLVIHPGDPDLVIAACGNLGTTGHGLYRTTDGGETWSRIVQSGQVPTTYGGKAQLALAPSDPDIVFASIGNSSGGNTATWLVRSLDAGATWSLRTYRDYSLWQGWFSHDVAVHPLNPNIVLTAGVDIWRSTTGGTALEQRSDWTAWLFGITPIGGPEGPPHYAHGDHHDIVWHPIDPDVVYIAGDGGVFRSLDAGLTFEACNGGLQTTQFYAGFTASLTDPDHAMGGLQDNSTAMFHGDEAWSRNIGGDGSWTAIHAANDSIVMGSWQYLNIVRSTDRGGEWFEVSTPLPGTPGFIAPYALAGPSAPDVGYAAGSYVGRSDDGGVTFQTANGMLPLNGDPALALAIAPSDADVVWVTTAPVAHPAAVFRSLDGGAGFQDVTGPLPDRYPVGLCVDPVDPLTAWVTFAGFGTGHVFRTRDGGASWDDVTGNLPDVPTLSVIVDPERPDHVYVGNDLGVFFSRDDGANWYDIGAGLGDAVMAMDLTVTADDLLLVSTYGNGCFTRSLERATTGMGDPAPRPRVELTCAPNPFNPATTLRFELERAGPVELAVYDVRGALVRTLLSGMMEEGPQAVRWDGRDESGREAPSGVYMALLTTADGPTGRRITLLR